MRLRTKNVNSCDTELNKIAGYIGEFLLMINEIMQKLLEMDFDGNGKLPEYTWPGDYSVFYIDGQNNIICAACANKEISDFKELGENYIDIGEMPVNYGITNEIDEDNLFCDGCSKAIA